VTDADSDSDGISDVDEGTADSDGDGLPDAVESNTADADSDGAADAVDADSAGAGGAAGFAAGAGAGRVYCGFIYSTDPSLLYSRVDAATAEADLGEKAQYIGKVWAGVTLYIKDYDETNNPTLTPGVLSATDDAPNEAMAMASERICLKEHQFKVEHAHRS